MKKVTSHIQDPDLRALYDMLDWQDYEVLKKGEKLLKREGDKLAVLQAMQKATENIIDDLDEHGLNNKYLYYNHGKSYFKTRFSDLEKEIDNLKKQGVTSSIFGVYVHSSKNKMEADVNDFFSEM